MFTEMRLERRLERLEVEEQRITERLAIVTIVALVLSVAGAATAAAGAERSATARALAAVTLTAGVGAGAQSWRLRRRIADLRGRKAEVQSAIEGRDEEPFAAAAASVSPGDVLGIERVLRVLYEAASGRPADQGWTKLRTLFAPGAHVEAGFPDRADPGVPVDRWIALARLESREVWFREVERTLHVLGDAAVALSAFEAHEPGAVTPSRGVNLVQLRRDRGAWRIAAVTSRPIAEPVTIRRTLAASSGPRPPPRAA